MTLDAHAALRLALAFEGNARITAWFVSKEAQAEAEKERKRQLAAERRRSLQTNWAMRRGTKQARQAREA